jgi:hypothetical protein
MKINNIFLIGMTVVAPVLSFTIPQTSREMSSILVNYLVNNVYDSAFDVITTNQRIRPDPLLPLFKLAVISMRDIDFDRTIDSTVFFDTYESVQAATLEYEKTNGITSYSQMVSGMSMAIYSAYHLRLKKYFPALQSGLDALALLAKSQELDTANYDVDLFLGLYEYARAELRSKLWWALFWYPGDKENGIQRVIRCSDWAIITSEAAKLSLCDIFIKEERYTEARQSIERMKKKYPSSRFVLWSEVKYFEALKENESAAKVYHRLSELSSTEKLGEYNTLFTRSREASLLYKAGKINDVILICDNMLQNSIIEKYHTLKRETIKLSERCHAAQN